jgi:DNA gyrase subunit B
MREYKADNIKILDGLDAVRKVPSMYIGNTNVEGLHHLVYELVDNSIDEALEGYSNKVAVTIHRDGSVTCEDNGRGIPTELHSSENMSALEVVLTKLHAGGKFDKDSYRYSAGLHGVGLSVVNALSEYLEVEVRRSGKVYFQRYERGERQNDLTIIGDTEKTGTKVRFKPDQEIFETTEFSYDTLAHRMREISFLNNGIHIALIDERKGRRQDFRHEGGVKSFVKYLNTNKSVLYDEPVFIAGSKQPLDFMEVSIQHNDGYNENIYSFVNNVNTQEGGSHVTGFRGALTRCVNNFIQATWQQKVKETISGDDVKEGLVAVISIKMQNPQFEGQTKAKLGNSEAKGLVESLLNEKLPEYFELYPEVAKAIAKKALDSKKAREAAKKAKELIKTKSLLENGLLPGKLADCQESDPEICELYIVEGDSAGGSAKQGRDRRTQAILPLKGKILNVEKSRQEKILINQEIRSIYLATGLGAENVGRLRYNKVIIMTDADVDGSHIRTLLLTLFYRNMPQLIENGYLYIAQPPLYKIKHGGKEAYIKDDDEFERFIVDRGTDRLKCRLEETESEGAQLKEALGRIRVVERYLREMEASGIKREGILALFRGVVVARVDFEKDDKLTSVARRLEVAGLPAEIIHDREHNLYALLVPGIKPDTTMRIDYELVGGGDYAEAYKAYAKSRAFYEGEIVIVDGRGEAPTMTVDRLLKFITDRGKEGISIQRYKGLGEMNPEQLWTTTMDPDKRSLVKVSIEDAVGADQVFTVLMGNNVETRRLFIEENALSVKNLDI